MTFPIIILLYAYYVFIAAWIILSSIAIYHMFRFGFKTKLTYAVILLYVSVSIVILAASFNYISLIDWDGEATMLQAFFQ